MNDPIPMRLTCPECGQLHVDAGRFATHPHHTHVCQHCGLTWRPAVVCTVGVRFLPGFKDSSGFAPVPAPPGMNVMPEATRGNSSRVSWLDAPRAGSDEVPWDGSHPPPAPPEEITTRCGCDESRSLKAEVFALQDRLMEYDEGDSAALSALRGVIDASLWDNEEEQERGDHLARLKEVAEQFEPLKRMKRDVERARARIQADRDRADSIVLAARELTNLPGGWTLPDAAANAVQKLRSALTEYDDYIPF